MEELEQEFGVARGERQAEYASYPVERQMQLTSRK
jgi:hypothetical protein